MYALCVGVYIVCRGLLENPFCWMQNFLFQIKLYIILFSCAEHVTEFTNNLLNTETTYGNKTEEEALDK